MTAVRWSLACYHRTGVGSGIPEVRVDDQQLGALVRELVAEGNRVAGYGAPAKGNTLLNLCGLDGAQLEFCSDTTPLKQGKVLPGTQ